jgi:outer membrane protein
MGRCTARPRDRDLIIDRAAIDLMTRLHCFAVVVICALRYSVADAQPTASGPGALTLAEAMSAALTQHPRVHLAEANVASYRGARQQAAAPFDGVLTSTATSSEARDVLPTGSTTSGLMYQTARRTAYALGFERAFRFGMTLSEELSLDQTRLAGSAVPGLGTGAAMLRLRVPLLSNRGGVVTRTIESAADALLDGAFADARQTQAQVVLDAAAAYWSYVAAGERLRLLERTEARARELVADTRQMVAADERPASDTLQVMATMALRTVGRLNAEQGLLESREQLGLAMGLPGSLALSIPAAGTPFPQLTSEVDALDTARAFVTTRWIAEAMRRRPDLKSLQSRERASDLELRSAEGALRPQMDLIVGAGYQGLVQGGRNLGGFFAPLRDNVPGLTSSIQIAMRMPTANALARGRLRMAVAGTSQRDIARRDAQRRVETGVTVAVSGVWQARQALRQAQRSVGLSEQAVDNERQKFRLGVATLFDVINAEDARLTASLSLINAQAQHAVALASLLFITGHAVSVTGPVVAADLTRLPPVVTP